MSGHQLSLGKLAQRGASLYISPLPLAMRGFYHSQSRLDARGQMAQEAVFDSASERRSARKVIGVKKTLVNQMQGMVRHPDPSKMPPYKIYGKTRLFSSTGSLHSQSPPSPPPRRWMSSGLKRKQQQLREEDSSWERRGSDNKITLSATQRRYNQSLSFGRGMATQAARDISRSIQEELMVVDDETRDMLNVNPNRNDARDTHEQATVDPMQGWNHPKAFKNMPGGREPAPEELEARQIRPRRRQLIMGHASHAANVAARNRETLAKPPRPQQLNPKPRVGQLGNMYSSNAQERVTELRPPANRYVPKTADKDSGDMLMDVALARNTRADITVARGIPQTDEGAVESEYESLYEQPKAERELLKQAFLSGTRRSRHVGQARLDELHYESSAGVGSNEALMSASRQVINQKFAGLQNLTGKQKRMAPHFVESVNPTPQLNPRAVSEARGAQMHLGKRRVSVRKHTERLATPQFFGALRESDRPPSREEGERKREDDDDEGRDEARNRYRKQDVGDSRAVKQSRVMASRPPRQRSMMQMSSQGESYSRREAEQKTRSRNASAMSRVAIGEKRDRKQVKQSKPMELEADSNELTMPSEYRKESAVQRLGSSLSAQFGGRAYNSY